MRPQLVPACTALLLLILELTLPCSLARRYEDLLHEWRTGRPVEACEKGAWEDDYTQMHAEMLAGEREASLLEFVCRAGEYCGGFADRCVPLSPSDALTGAPEAALTLPVVPPAASSA